MEGAGEREDIMSIEVSQNAQTELDKQVPVENRDGAVRIILNGFGWGGPSFGIVLDKQKENDYTQAYGDIKVVVESDLLNQFNGFIIDYVNNWLRKGFTVTSLYGGSSC